MVCVGAGGGKIIGIPTDFTLLSPGDEYEHIRLSALLSPGDEVLFVIHAHYQPTPAIHLHQVAKIW